MINPENSSEFSARRADELQNAVNLYVMSNSWDKPTFSHHPNLGVNYFAVIRVNPDVIN